MATAKIASQATTTKAKAIIPGEQPQKKAKVCNSLGSPDDSNYSATVVATTAKATTERAAKAGTGAASIPAAVGAVTPEEEEAAFLPFLFLFFLLLLFQAISQFNQRQEQTALREEKKGGKVCSLNGVKSLI